MATAKKERKGLCLYVPLLLISQGGWRHHVCVRSKKLATHIETLRGCHPNWYENLIYFFARVENHIVWSPLKKKKKSDSGKLKKTRTLRQRNDNKHESTRAICLFNFL